MNFVKVLSSQGMESHPATIDDHRKLILSLGSGKEEYHTYCLPEDATLRVLGSIPVSVNISDIEAGLSEKGFTVGKISRFDRRNY